MNFIVEAWCSPLRQEVYSQKVIDLSTTCHTHIGLDDLKEYMSTDFFYDVFGEDYYDVGGLYKVVVRLSLQYWDGYDWEGVPEGGVDVCVEEVLFKSKCDNWGELKWNWLELSGQLSDYYDKVMSKQMREWNL